MLKTLKFLTLATITIFSFCCYASENYDFKKTTWGMNREEVMATETTKPYKGNFIFKVSKDILIYNNVKVAEIETSLKYRFENDLLVSASYKFIENNPPKIYEKLKKLLIGKYGVPAEDSDLWKNENSKNLTAPPNEQISLGNLSLKTVWFLDRTKIVLNINKINDTGVNFVATEITYYKRTNIKNDLLHSETTDIKVETQDTELTKNL